MKLFQLSAFSFQLSNLRSKIRSEMRHQHQHQPSAISKLSVRCQAHSRQASGIWIGRNRPRSEYGGRDRNGDVGRNDHDDNGKASRCNSRHRNRDSESERDRYSEREREKDGYAHHAITEEEIVDRQWHSTHHQNSDNSSSHLQIRKKDAVSSADSAWASRMLHAQELIERRLGRGYY
jgi:hypothetical protein